MDDDLIAYLEKKIKTLEAERDHWKANHDNQVAIKQAISQRPDLQDRAARVTGLVAEIERLKAELKSFDVTHDGESQLSFFIKRAKEFEEKASVLTRELNTERMQRKEFESLARSLEKELAAVPHWVPVTEFKAVEDEFYFVFGYLSGSLTPCEYQCRFNGIAWFWQGLVVNVTHVLVGLKQPFSSEDPRGDGDLLPESERLDDLTRGCMRDKIAASSNDLAGDASDIERAIRERLLQPFLGSEAEVLGATKYQPLDDEKWEYLSLLDKWERASSVPHWYSNVKYRLAKGD